MPITYTQMPLYGGAMTCDLPSDFTNVSSIRQVPDHQEVFLCRTSLSSIIIETTERVGPALHGCASDEDALQYHYHDIITAEHGSEDQGNKDAAENSPREITNMWVSNHVNVKSLGPDVPAYTLFATQHPESWTSNDRSKYTRDFTGILLTLVRFIDQKTDLLITINVPHVPGEYRPEEVDLAGGKLGYLMYAAMEHRDRILQSLTIEDWGLFV